MTVEEVLPTKNTLIGSSLGSQYRKGAEMSGDEERYNQRLLILSTKFRNSSNIYEGLQAWQI